MHMLLFEGNSSSEVRESRTVAWRDDSAAGPHHAPRFHLHMSTEAHEPRLCLMAQSY
jgi:hypothetical protein